MAAVFVQLERATQVALLLGGGAEFQAKRRSALRGVALVRIVRLARISFGCVIGCAGVFLLACALGRLRALVVALLVGESVAGAVSVRAAR